MVSVRSHSRSARSSGATRDHWPKIIEAREKGLTYQEIGDGFGITRERVRQILVQIGRKDLLIRLHRSRNTPIWTCQNCDKKFKRSQYDAFCSSSCRKIFRNNVFYKRDLPRAQKITQHRRARKTWTTTAAYTGFKGKRSCHTWFTEFCEKHGRQDLLKGATGFRIDNE